jgi:signal transduction histidine kinase
MSPDRLQRPERPPERFPLDSAAGNGERLLGEMGNALLSISRRLSSALTVADVINVIIPHVVVAVGAAMGSVAMVTDARNEVEVVEVVGYPADVLEGMKRFPLSAPIPLADAIRTGEPVWLGTLDIALASYPFVRCAVEGTMSRAWASIPLRAYDLVIGGVGLSFATPREFATAERQSILAILEQCQQAIVRARRYDQALAASHARRLFALLDGDQPDSASATIPSTGRGLARKNTGGPRRTGGAGGQAPLERLPVETNGVIARVVDICRSDIHDRSILLEQDLRAHRATVLADPSRLEQALRHLLQNQIQRCDRRGHVAIRTRNTEHHRLVVSIEGSGDGNDPSWLEHLFDPSYRDAEADSLYSIGMGMELAASKAIIQLHGGSLRAHGGARGVATRFTIVLDTLDSGL